MPYSRARCVSAMGLGLARPYNAGRFVMRIGVAIEVGVKKEGVIFHIDWDR